MRTLPRPAALLPAILLSAALVPPGLLLTSAPPAHASFAAQAPRRVVDQQRVRLRAGAQPTRGAAGPAWRAAQAAAALLAAFRPPRHAVRLDSPPAEALAAAPEHPPAVDLVTRTSYWRATGRPRTVLDWIERHHASGLTWTGGGQTTADRAVVLYFAEFTAGRAATDQGRTLLVSVARASAGAGTSIRVDAQVTWLPRRARGERVPSGSRALTVMYLPGPGRVEQITDPSLIRRVAGVADGLPPAVPWQLSCPADFGRRLRLTFRAAPAAAPLAVLTAQLGGCGLVTMTVGGHTYPALGGATELADALPGRTLHGGWLMH